MGKISVLLFSVAIGAGIPEEGSVQENALDIAADLRYDKSEDLCRRFPGEGTQRRYYSRERYLSRRRGEGT